MQKPDKKIVDDVEYWYFTSLPTAKQLQKHRPNLVRMQDRLRPLLEKGLIDALIDCEWLQRHDYVHHRGSGLDMVIVKLLAQHNVTVFVDMDALRTQPAPIQAVLLGRIMQNKRLCAKAGVSMRQLCRGTSSALDL